MSRFQICLAIVLAHEGGYSDVANDRGGKTNYGITQATYSGYLRRMRLPDRSVKEIHISEVEAIYHEYWKDARCDVMPDGVDLVVFDTAINSGAIRAIKILQQVLGVAIDGIYGRITAEALREEVRLIGAEGVSAKYLDEREDFFYKIVDNDSTQKKFLAGWLNRVDRLRESVA